MTVKHNKEMEIEKYQLNNGLEIILAHATEWNKYAYECITSGNYKQATIYSEVRDAFLTSYYEITDVRIDYGDLEKE